MTPSFPRRRTVSMIGVAMLSPLAATPALGEDLPPTPRFTEGPFYPQSLPADTDADLTRVEIWQCDAGGRYHHVGEPEQVLDAGFQGFGAVTTDAEGRYRFRTIKPVPYPGRTPHIHLAA